MTAKRMTAEGQMTMPDGRSPNDHRMTAKRMTAEGQMTRSK